MSPRLARHTLGVFASILVLAARALAGYSIPVEVQSVPPASLIPQPVATMVSPDGSLWGVTINDQFVVTFESTDGGATWARRNTWVGPGWRGNDVDVPIQAAAGSGVLDVLIAGASYGPAPRPLMHARSRDGGSVWSRLHTVVDGGQPGWYGVAASPEGTVAAVWLEQTGCRAFRLALSTDDGRTWSEPVPLTPAPERPCAGMTAESLWGVSVVWPEPDVLLFCWTEIANDASGRHSQLVCRRSGDRGRTFAPPVVVLCAPPNETASGWGDIVVRGPGDVLAFANFGAFQSARSTDGGTTWSLPSAVCSRSCPRDSQGAPTAAGTPSTDTWISWTDTSYKLHLARSVDGTSWSETKLPTVFSCSGWLSRARESTLFPYGRDSLVLGQRVFFRSLDGGESWDAPPDTVPPPSATGLQLAGRPDQRMLATWIEDVGAPGELRASLSTDGGATWSGPRRVNDAVLAKVVRDPGRSFLSAAAARAAGGFAAVWLARDEGGCAELRASVSDDGLTWEPSQAIGPADSTSVALVEDGAGRLVAAWINRALTTSASLDGGRTWLKPVVAGGTEIPTVQLAATSDGGVVLASTQGGSVYLLRSDDGGRTWRDGYGMQGNGFGLVTAGDRLVLLVDSNGCAKRPCPALGRESSNGGRTWRAFDPGIPAGCAGCLLAGSSSGTAYLADMQTTIELRALRPDGSWDALGHAGWTPLAHGPAGVLAGPGADDLAFLFQGEAMALPPGAWFARFSPGTPGLARATFSELPSPVDIGAAFPLPVYLEYAYPGMVDPVDVLLDPGPLFVYDAGADAGNRLALVKHGGRTVRLTW